MVFERLLILLGLHNESMKEHEQGRRIWAQGFIDGDGWITISSRTGVHAVLYAVKQASASGVPETLKELKRLYGGSISGPRVSDNPNERLTYTLTVTQRRGNWGALLDLAQFGIIKSRQALVGFYQRMQTPRLGSRNNRSLKRATGTPFRI